MYKSVYSMDIIKDIDYKLEALKVKREQLTAKATQLGIISSTYQPEGIVVNAGRISSLIAPKAHEKNAENRKKYDLRKKIDKV